MQSYIDEMLRRSRRAEFAASGQLSLGDLISKIAAVKSNDAEVIFDFCGAFPVNLISWRGVYAELALEFAFPKFGGSVPMKVGLFQGLLESAVGQTFDGYKGGEYRMDRDTPLWVDNYGECNHTAVMGLLVASYQVIIVTRHLEEE